MPSGRAACASSGSAAKARASSPEMHDWQTVLAALPLFFWLGATWEVMRGNRRLKRLATLTAPVPLVWPRASVIFAARNEGRTLGAAVPTMLALDYPDFELIAVDDRSEDDTGAVLDRLAAANPRVKGDHVREMPPGGDGKEHALRPSARQANGEESAFTSAHI